MKIGFLLNYFHPFTGGREKNCLYLAQELAKHHEVHVFTSDRKDKQILPKEEIYKNIHIHRSKPLFRYKYYLEFIPGNLTQIAKYKLDILNVHSFGFITNDLIVLYKRLFTKTKLLNTPHGPFMALKKYPFPQTIMKILMLTFEKIVNKCYHKVIQVNPNQYEIWMKDYGIKQHQQAYIPNGIPENNLIQTNKTEFLKKHPKLKNKLIISYLGRIQKYKGLEQVIRVLPDLIKKHPKLMFLGMGIDTENEIPRLQNIAKELNVENNIYFTEVTDEEKMQGLQASEIFVFPSEWEAFGIVLLEAMSQKNAVVTSNTEGGSFLIQKENGFVYKYQNINELKYKLDQLLSNKTLIKQMQKNNFEKASKFTWEKIAKDLEQLYIKLLNHPKTESLWKFF